VSPREIRVKPRDSKLPVSRRSRDAPAPPARDRLRRGAPLQWRTMMYVYPIPAAIRMTASTFIPALPS
jgi:hypothetical protein